MESNQIDFLTANTFAQSHFENPLVIYHGNCLDGFTAAWTIRRAIPKADFYPGIYNEPPPEVEGRVVILVDFSYPSNIIYEMAKTAKRILIFDHHKSAIEDIRTNLATFIYQFNKYETWKDYDRLHCIPSIGVLFDIERSGAGIAWDFFFPDAQRPELIDIVEDQDLWRFRFKSTRYMMAYIASHDYTWENWDMINNMLDEQPTSVIERGVAMLQSTQKNIIKLLEATKFMIHIQGYEVPCANVPYMWGSEAGEILCNDFPFSATYYETGTHRVYSLRSNKETGIDVSEIAKKFGGGGHKNASGFRIKIEQLKFMDKDN